VDVFPSTHVSPREGINPDGGKPDELTYSIVARDPRTGEMGVAVQSHYFSVGSVVTWARAGVGAVATQAIVEPKYGPLGLELMASGKSAQETLKALLALDPSPELRQVAMVDSKGGTASHTGSKCIPYAGHTAGDGVSCQGNIMRTSRVWKEMRRAFEKNRSLPLPERLVTALDAAEEAGGDARGKQSAAMLVVSGEVGATEWGGRVLELRVEDHREPLKELRRLLRYRRAYDCMDEGDNQLTAGKVSEALRSYSKALELVPEVDEIKYWVGISMLQTRQKEKGLSFLKDVFAKDTSYVGITKRMIKARSLPIDQSVKRALG
jgi:uncharacterized Ntn-hydrolase superfamily protein